jgi:hypothetical protein
MSCSRSSPARRGASAVAVQSRGTPRRPESQPPAGYPRRPQTPPRDPPRTVDRCVDRPVEKAVYAGDNTGCPVDGQRILRLVPASPCAGPSPGSRKALTTSGASPTGGDPGQSGGNSRTCGEPGNRSSARVSGTRWRSAADSSRATGQPSNRHAGLSAERGPLHLIHGGAPVIIVPSAIGPRQRSRPRGERASGRGAPRETPPSIPGDSPVEPQPPGRTMVPRASDTAMRQRCPGGEDRRPLRPLARLRNDQRCAHPRGSGAAHCRPASGAAHCRPASGAAHCRPASGATDRGAGHEGSARSLLPGRPRRATGDAPGRGYWLCKQIAHNT